MHSSVAVARVGQRYSTTGIIRVIHIPIIVYTAYSLQGTKANIDLNFTIDWLQSQQNLIHKVILVLLPTHLDLGMFGNMFQLYRAPHIVSYHVIMLSCSLSTASSHFFLSFEFMVSLYFIGLSFSCIPEFTSDSSSNYRKAHLFHSFYLI